MSNREKNPRPFARWQVPAICLALAVMTFAVFGQTGGFDFVNFDDNLYVYENPVVAGGLSLQGVEWTFSHPDCQLYHPLTMLSLMADHQFHGLHPGGYHLANVLLHAASVILLFLILRSMTGALWPSAFVAAVFAIHPLRAESVAWISERKDVLGGLLFMATLGAYAHYARQPKSRARYAMVIAAFALALLAKPTVVTLPFVLLLLDWWPLRRTESIRRLILEKLPLLALAAVASVLTVLAAGEGITTQAQTTPWVRLGNALVSYAAYLRQMVWPEGLAVFYPMPQNGQPLSSVALSFILLAAITAVVLIFGRSRRWLLVGWLWYLGMLVPMIGIVQASDFAHADRMTYLPQIGIYMALAWSAVEWGIGRAALGLLASGVLVLLMVMSFQQTGIWRNSETLWTYTLACTTNNPVADDNYGLVLMQNGRTDDAIGYFQRAIDVNPNLAEGHNNLGTALLQIGRVDDAIAQCQRAIELKPGDAQAHANLANALFQKGNLDDAITEFRKTLSLNPSLAMAHNNLGAAFLRKGDDDKAMAQYEVALQLNPGLADAHFNLANLLAKKGETAHALFHFEQAVKLDPTTPKFKQRLEEVERTYPFAKSPRKP